MRDTISKTSKSKNKWIKECWDYHSQHIDECDIAPDWGDWKTDWNMCWCCGQKTSHLQRCHIIPKSLGVTFLPIILSNKSASKACNGCPCSSIK